MGYQQRGAIAFEGKSTEQVDDLPVALRDNSIIQQGLPPTHRGMETPSRGSRR
jgi:hypothetical protein